MAKKHNHKPEAAVVEETPAPPVVPALSSGDVPVTRSTAEFVVDDFPVIPEPAPASEPPSAPAVIYSLRKRHGFAVRHRPDGVLEMGFIESVEGNAATFQPLARIASGVTTRVGDPAALVTAPITDFTVFD